MTRLAKTLLVLLLFLVALLVGHHNAQAATQANQPDSRLDAIASTVAGHPVTVFCENDQAEWDAGTAPKSWGYTFAPHWNLGPPLQNVVWVHPRVCAALHGVLDNRDTTSPFEAALAIHVLVHESVHQRDGIYTTFVAGDAYPNSFEGRTDCAALAFDETAETTLFGYPTTVTLNKVDTTYTWLRRKVKRHWHRTRVKHLVVMTETVRNSVLDYMRAVQLQYHNDIATTSPAYRGDC